MRENVTYSNEDEVRLIEQAKTGCREAEMSIIRNHAALILLLAKRLNRGIEFRDELIQAGNIGLLNAIRHYQPDCKTKLITYAFPWILGEMKLTLKNHIQFYQLLQPYEEDIASSSHTIDIKHIDLHIAMEKLNEIEKNLIFLRYFRDKTQNETALLLKRSQAQISKLERRALKQLEDYLTQ